MSLLAINISACLDGQGRVPQSLNPLHRARQPDLKSCHSLPYPEYYIFVIKKSQFNWKLFFNACFNILQHNLSQNMLQLWIYKSIQLSVYKALYKTVVQKSFEIRLHDLTSFQNFPPKIDMEINYISCKEKWAIWDGFLWIRHFPVVVLNSVGLCAFLFSLRLGSIFLLITLKLVAVFHWFRYKNKFERE